MAAIGAITVDVTNTDLFCDLCALTTDMLEALPPERQSEFVARVDAIISRARASDRERLERAEYRLKWGGP